MSVKSRLLALKLLEKQKRNPEYAKQIGVEVNVVSKKEAIQCVNVQALRRKNDGSIRKV